MASYRTASPHGWCLECIVSSLSPLSAPSAATAAAAAAWEIPLVPPAPFNTHTPLQPQAFYSTLYMLARNDGPPNKWVHLTMLLRIVGEALPAFLLVFNPFGPSFNIDLSSA